MKTKLEEHAGRFSQIATDYNDKQNNDEHNACASLVIDHADPRPNDVVLDLGTGTGLITLALARKAEHVVGRDISEGMLEQARVKAADSGIENVEFDYGEFRDPQYDGEVDIVVSNFALHHLPDEEKREAIEVIAALGPRRFVLGDAMFFGEAERWDSHRRSRNEGSPETRPITIVSHTLSPIGLS